MRRLIGLACRFLTAAEMMKKDGSKEDDGSQENIKGDVKVLQGYDWRAPG
jgi:hypothetical protein